MNNDHRPAQPGGDDKETSSAGFAAVARRLNELFPERPRPISRQLVHKWFLHRHYNGFPAAFPAGSGMGRPVFDMEAVVDWYISHRRHHGGEPLIEQTASPAPLIGKDSPPPSETGAEGTLAA